MKKERRRRCKLQREVDWKKINQRANKGEERIKRKSKKWENKGRK